MALKEIPKKKYKKARMIAMKDVKDEYFDSLEQKLQSVGEEITEEQFDEAAGEKDHRPKDPVVRIQDLLGLPRLCRPRRPLSTGRREQPGGQRRALKSERLAADHVSRSCTTRPEVMW